jgi:hypothetical protein
MLGVVLLSPGASLGADGDSCDSAQWDGSFGGRLVKGASCVLLCDDMSTSAACGDGFFEMNRHMFSYVVFHVEHDSGGCSGELDIETLTHEDATPVTVTNLTLGGTGERHLVNVANPSSVADVIYPKLTVSGGAGFSCTGSIDVMMIGYEVGR